MWQYLLPAILGIASLFGSRGGGGQTDTAAPAQMDPELRQLLFGNPQTAATAARPGLLSFEFARAQRADPLHAAVVALAQQLLPGQFQGPGGVMPGYVPPPGPPNTLGGPPGPGGRRNKDIFDNPDDDRNKAYAYQGSNWLQTLPTWTAMMGPRT